MGRLKSTSLAKLSVALRGWDQPVILQGDTVPPTFRNIPVDLCPRFIASGELLAPAPYVSPRIGLTRRVGGIYVIRLAPDGPEPYDRDDYALIPSTHDPDALLIDDSDKHPTEHWLRADQVDQLISISISISIL
ncbi:MAG TPA: hypothetical protein VNJ70_08590 [Thermoanaerobaculia bacterium]|nr:hypothetical protein [Thermoanaerobaculia bacterium]